MTTKEAAHILRGCFSPEPKITPAAEIAQAVEIAIKALEWIGSKVDEEDGESAVKAMAKMFEEIEAINADLREKLKHEIERNEKAEDEQRVNAELSFRQGVINGLKYAIRCNGVSGGDIHE